MTDHDTLILNTDGGSRGNPGPAAAGLVLSNESGKPLYAEGRFLGQATNNVAEYKGLIHGMTRALEMDCLKLIAFADSELMVRQVNGLYRVKNARLKPLYEQVCDLIDRFDSFKLTHVRREYNKLADEMANLALDRKGHVIRDHRTTLLSDDHPDAQTQACDDDSADQDVRLIARCTQSAGGCCPGGVADGDVMDLPGFADGNLCMYAVAAIVDGYLDGKGDGFVARCRKPGCNAVFNVAVSSV